VLRTTSPPRVPEVSTPPRARVPGRDSLASGAGQLWHPQASPRPSLDEAHLVLSRTLCHQFQLAKSGGALVWRINQQANPPRLLRQRGRSREGDHGVPGRLEREPEALCLDCHCGIHRSEAIALSAELGNDSAGLHSTASAKGETLSCQLFFGHYTRSLLKNGTAERPWRRPGAGRRRRS